MTVYIFEYEDWCGSYVELEMPIGKKRLHGLLRGAKYNPPYENYRLREKQDGNLELVCLEMNGTEQVCQTLKRKEGVA